MNRIIKIFALLLSVGLFFQSCDDFLKVDPHIGLDADKAITDIPSLQAALVGTYDGMQHYYSYGRDFIVFGDVLTDNIKVSPTNSNRFQAEAAWAWTSSTGDFSTYWQRAYTIINRANSVINTPVPGDQATIDQLVGEAHAIRALIHFDLVRLFAQDYNFTADHSHLGVPYILKYDPDGRPTRNTVAEVYENILKDLEIASKKVKKLRISGPYMFSPNAINALYARVYLFMGNYSKAKEYAELLLPKYELIPGDNKYLDSWKERYNSETIFAISQTEVDYMATSALGYIYIEAGYGDLLVNPAFVSLFEKDDVRNGWFVKGVAAKKKDNIYIKGKYPGRDNKPGLDNYNVFRISEMYLIAAESQARLGNESKAIEYLDKIRQRALSTAKPTTLKGQALIDAILLEKRKELGFEGHYFHDLKRLQMTVTGPVKGTGATGPVIKYGDDRFAWPIPQDEIEANPNIAKQQNPGY